MGALIGIVAIVVYYTIISNFIDASSSPGFLVATAYVLVPLVFIPIIVSTVRSGTKPDSKNSLIKEIAVISGIIGISIIGILLADRLLMPSAPDPIADEQSRQAEWIVRGQDAVKAKLKDPSSAEFRGVYFNRGKDGLPVTCGEVNSKNSFGGYGGFQKFISAGSAELTFLAEQVDRDEFAKVWNKMCIR